ncbi:MAG TPA: M15 family metallopeptidase [Actinomycetota bacterium]|nr:M15 family metallopeptidase [Actinomycetota bacterium]
MRRAAGFLVAVVLGSATGAGVMLSLPAGGAGGRQEVLPGPVASASPRPPPEVLGKAPVSTMLAWTPTRLPAGYARAVRALPQVRAVAVVRSGTAWLASWRHRSGTRQRAPRGFMVPLEVAAVAPSGYRRFVPPAERQAIAGLDGGGALLGSTSAEIRGVRPAGSLRFPARTIRVEGVIDDGLVGGHEAVVSVGTGTRLGIVTPRYLLVLPRAGVSRTRLERGLRAAAPAGVRVQVRGPGETPVFRHGDAVLPPVRLKEIFGEFAARPAPGGTLTIDPAWVRENIRSARMPILRGHVTCHRRIIPLLRGALSELARRGLGDLVVPGMYGGCYSPRFLNFNPPSGLSHHAWGIAVDFNVAENPYGAKPAMDPRVVEVMRRWGFTWGGRWIVPDGMHFEFHRFPNVG